MRKLTEPKAWREVSRRIVEGEWDKRGLCREVAKLYYDNRIAECTIDGMQENIDLYLPEDMGWAYPPGEEPEARALAALWLALEAKEEN